MILYYTFKALLYWSYEGKAYTEVYMILMIQETSIYFPPELDMSEADVKIRRMHSQETPHITVKLFP